MTRWHFECPACGTENKRPASPKLGSGAPDHRCMRCQVPMFPGAPPTAPVDFDPALKKALFGIHASKSRAVQLAKEIFGVALGNLQLATTFAQKGNHQAAGDWYRKAFEGRFGALAAAAALDSGGVSMDPTPCGPRVSELRNAFAVAKEAGADW